jgi:hypothetical protein
MFDPDLYQLMSEYEALSERNGMTINQFLSYVEMDHGELVAAAFKDFYQTVTGSKIPVDDRAV